MLRRRAAPSGVDQCDVGRRNKECASDPTGLKLLGTLHDRYDAEVIPDQQNWTSGGRNAACKWAVLDTECVGISPRHIDNLTGLEITRPTHRPMVSIHRMPLYTQQYVNVSRSHAAPIAEYNQIVIHLDI